MAASGVSYTQRLNDLRFDYCTIPECLEKIAKTTPDKNAFVFLSQNGERLAVLTFKELYDRSVEFARGMINLGIRKGDVVAIGLPNISEWPICTFGTMIAGAIPMNFTFYKKDGSDLISLCESVKASCIVYHPGHEFKHTEILEHFIDESNANGQVKSKKLPSLKYTICTEDSNQGSSKGNFMLLSELIELDKQTPKERLPCLDPDDVALFMLTSGSTDRPKIIPWSHFGVLNAGKAYFSIYGSDQNTICFNDRPFNWIGGWPFYLLLTGSTRVTLSDIHGMKSLKEIAELTVKAIESEKCTVGLLIPPCLQILLQGSIPLGQQWPIKVLATGGLPVPSVFTKAIGPIAIKLVNAYACSEVGFMALNEISDPASFKNFSVGDVITGSELKIVDENGQIVSRGVQGELCFRSSIRFRGYVGDAERSNASVTEAGWYKTGDVGIMFEDGNIVVHGRSSNTINIGGTKLIPSDLQGLLRKHPDVLDVFILSVLDDAFINVACACVMSRPGSNLTHRELKDFVERQYSLDPNTYSGQVVVPKYYVLMNVLPRTPGGKIDQKSLRAAVYAELNIQTKQ